MLARNDELATNSRGQRTRWGAAAAASGTDPAGDETIRWGRVAIDHVPHGVLVVGENGDVVAANQLAELVFGFGPGRLTGRPFEQLLLQLLLQLPDLKADGRGGDEQLVGCSDKAAVAGRGPESAERVKRGETASGTGHDDSSGFGVHRISIPIYEVDN